MLMVGGGGAAAAVCVCQAGSLTGSGPSGADVRNPEVASSLIPIIIPSVTQSNVDISTIYM